MSARLSEPGTGRLTTESQRTVDDGLEGKCVLFVSSEQHEVCCGKGGGACLQAEAEVGREMSRSAAGVSLTRGEKARQRGRPLVSLTADLEDSVLAEQLHRLCRAPCVDTHVEVDEQPLALQSRKRPVTRSDRGITHQDDPCPRTTRLDRSPPRGVWRPHNLVVGSGCPSLSMTTN
jgi:hypothetical protein